MATWRPTRMSKAAVAMLLRTTWHTIDALLTPLVADHLDSDRFDGIYRIGGDEIAYRKRRKVLTASPSSPITAGRGRACHRRTQ
jgi:hypothetical protein